jgi:hypothetical protein
MQLINEQMREQWADALHTDAVPEAKTRLGETCLAVSQPVPLGSTVPPFPSWDWPSEARISYCAGAAAPTHLPFWTCTQLPAVSQRSKRRLHRHHNLKHGVIELCEGEVDAVYGFQGQGGTKRSRLDWTGMKNTVVAAQTLSD